MKDVAREERQSENMDRSRSRSDVGGRGRLEASDSAIYSHICDPITTCMVPFPAAAKSHQSCPTLCDPIDGSPPGSSVPGILQARTLEWVAISFSNA